MRRRPALNVVGYFRSESGVGQAARAVVAGLDASGATVLPIHPHDVPPSRQGSAYATVPPEEAQFGINLLCLTALETPGFAASVPASFFADRHTIGLWWWEVERFPEVMHAGFQYVDEVWVASEHVARALRSAGDSTPITRIRVPVLRSPPSRASRPQLGLPDGHLFLTTFGYYSSVVRKNPMGVIQAFTRAFAPGEGPSLVVKSIDHEAHPAEHACLAALADGHPDVHLLPGYIDEEEMGALVHHADTVVSLHRAEGFGFVAAEAMALGKPVIATRYSGNLDYMTDANAFLVDMAMRPIGPEGAPYPSGGRWADPDVGHATELMRLVVEDPAEAERRAKRAESDMAAHYSLAAAGATMRGCLESTYVRQPWAPRARYVAARMARRRRAASTYRNAAPLPYAKACEIEDFAHPDLLAPLREVFFHEAHRFGATFPAGHEYRKHWEVAMAIRALQAGRCLTAEAEVLGVGAGNEPTIFWLTNHVRRVFATDLYLHEAGWNHSANRSMLMDPGRHWPASWRRRRLVAQHMDARALDYEDGSFDAVFSSSSLEHVGGERDVASAVDEMFRVLKPGGVLTLSTELRLAGPSPGLPGTLLFDADQLRDLIVGRRRWQLMSTLRTDVSPRTLATEQSFVDAAADVRRHVAQYGEIRFHELEWSRYPHIVLRHGDHVWTSVHLALRKDL